MSISLTKFVSSQNAQKDEMIRKRHPHTFASKLGLRVRIHSIMEGEERAHTYRAINMKNDAVRFVQINDMRAFKHPDITLDTRMFPEFLSQDRSLSQMLSDVEVADIDVADDYDMGSYVIVYPVELTGDTQIRAEYDTAPRPLEIRAD